MADTVCNLLDGLSNEALNQMGDLNGQFSSLQRVAELLEAGAFAFDPLSFLPNPGFLIPIDQINLATFNQLAARCPQLGLSIPDLGSLKAQVLDAYKALLDRILEHPWAKLLELQREMDRFALHGVGLNCNTNITALLKCATAACDTLAALPGTLEENQRTLDNFTKNFGTNAGVVLTQSQQLKALQVQALAKQVRAVM